MTENVKDTQLSQISAMVTCAMQRREGGSQLSLAGQEAFRSVPSRVDKSAVK